MSGVRFGVLSQVVCCGYSFGIAVIDVTSVIESGNHVTFSGNALVSGSATTYRSGVTVKAEPGIGTDMFAIRAGGYIATGTLTQGNIQIHG